MCYVSVNSHLSYPYQSRCLDLLLHSYCLIGGTQCDVGDYLGFRCIAVCGKQNCATYTTPYSGNVEWLNYGNIF